VCQPVLAAAGRGMEWKRLLTGLHLENLHPSGSTQSASGRPRAARAVVVRTWLFVPTPWRQRKRMMAISGQQRSQYVGARCVEARLRRLRTLRRRQSIQTR
jgi:hypothetical protein